MLHARSKTVVFVKAAAAGAVLRGVIVDETGAEVALVVPVGLLTGVLAGEHVSAGAQTDGEGDEPGDEHTAGSRERREQAHAGSSQHGSRGKLAACAASPQQC